jgi:16S rRNA (cytosine967-C5)-methyltransferase
MILRLGAAQVLYMQVPPHAAVGETVELVRGPITPMKGLVNAVLRRLQDEQKQVLEALDQPRVNTPGWLFESWSAAFGRQGARAIAAAQLAEPPLDLSVKEDAEGWAEKLGAKLLPSGTLRLPAGSGDVTALPGYDEGAWWVQDAAAALPVRMMGAGDAATLWDKRALDLCAAPGGKTLQLVTAGAEVTAVDQSAERLQRVRANLKRLGLTAELAVADASTFEAPTPFDFVLLDAPCSATGTIRRHPDLPHIKGTDDAKRLVPLQDQLLARAAELTAPGGTLVYTVCSLDPAEGADRVAKFLGSRGDFRRTAVDAKALGIDPDWMTPDGDLRTLPFHLGDQGGMDGFFAAVLKRNVAAH